MNSGQVEIVGDLLSKDGHTKYQVKCTGTGDNIWTVQKRFSEFDELHKTLVELDPRVEGFTFPPKKKTRSTDDKSVAARRAALMAWSNEVLALCTSPQVRS
eukprot:SAG11_NODE_22740_length_401_cov_0.609272_1_plen_100_part_10